MTRKNPPYLQYRRRRWYAVMEIPKDVRHKFDGKARFLESLKTESLSEAEQRKWLVIANWKAEIEAARTGQRKSKLDPVALAEELKVGRDSDGTDMREIRDGFISDTALDLDGQDPLAAEIFSKVVHGETTPIAKHIEDWLGQLDNEPKTKDMKRADARRFAAAFEYTHQVDRRSVQKWAHDLQHGDAGLSLATLRRILSALRGYWDYLNRVGHISREDDPFKDALPKASKRSKSSYEEERKAFSVGDLGRLLEAAERKDDQVLRDFIEIAMWTGCRIEEIASLKMVNVGVDGIEIVDAKSRAGNRQVPIHSRLQPTVKRLLAESDDGYLLSGLSANKYGDRSNAVGKRFGRLKESLAYDDRFVFHSIRKTVATELENLGVPENVAADILGHDKPTMTYGTYSGGTAFGVKQEAIEKLHYSEIKVRENC